MSCPDCTEAARRRWHRFDDACTRCRARQVSRLPSYRDSQLSGRQTATYRGLLAAFSVTHEQVKDAAERDHALNGGTCASA